MPPERRGPTDRRFLSRNGRQDGRERDGQTDQTKAARSLEGNLPEAQGEEPEILAGRPSGNDRPVRARNGSRGNREDKTHHEVGDRLRPARGGHSPERGETARPRKV